MNRLDKLKSSIIEKGYRGSDALPVLARGASDPGEEYFRNLQSELKQLFDDIEDDETIDRELACALFGLGHIAYVNYEAAINHGVEFRDTLMDPDMIDVEMAVDSIFSGEWIEL